MADHDPFMAGMLVRLVDLDTQHMYGGARMTRVGAPRITNHQSAHPTSLLFFFFFFSSPQRPPKLMKRGGLPKRQMVC